MKIVCIGRNYKEHAKELKNPLPQKPIFFLKPETALLNRNKPFYYPEFSEDIHYEIELVIKIGKNGKHIKEKFAASYYQEVALGIDFTARDIQQNCKTKGLPWEIAKGFDNSAPLSKFVSMEGLPAIDNMGFRLELNGKTVQDGNSKNMIFSVDHIISYVSQFITLKMGDIIFTGTPEGVGPVKIGDRLVGYLENQEMFNFQVR